MTSRRGRCELVAVFAAALLAAGGARADEGRFQDFAAGARAAALGGAYGALSDDATGIFYNPAGLVDVRTARLNVATSLYGLEILGKTPVESDLLQRGITPADLIFVPSSTGYVQGVGDTLPSGAYSDAVAFGTLVPEYTSRFSETVPTDDVRGTGFRSALTDRRLIAGAAWAHRFGPWLRFGLSGQYLLRTLDAEESLVSGKLDIPGAFIDASTRLRMSSHAFRLSTGGKLWLGPRTTLGLALTTPALSVWRDAQFERVVASSDGGDSGYDADRIRATGFELQSDFPGSARVGFAYTEPASYTFAVDVTGYLGTTYDVLSPELLRSVSGANLARVPLALHVDRAPVANVAVGVDTLVADDVSVALGFFTNFTGAPPLDVNKAGALTATSSRLSRVNMLGGSLSLGFHGRFSVTRFGLTGSSGYGDVVRPTEPDVRFLDQGPPLIATEQWQTLVYVFWSSTFRFGEESSGRDYTL